MIGLLMKLRDERYPSFSNCSDSILPLGPKLLEKILSVILFLPL